MSRSGEFSGWRMVAIAFLAQNCAVVMANGAYGTALATIERDLDTTRAMASSALGLMLMSLGLLSPLVGNLLQRFTIRTAMTVGAILNAVGYLIVAFATDFLLILVSFGLLIGPGACLMGPLTVSTLVSRWFERDRGKALGIANMPLFLLISPPLAAFLLIQGGRQLLFVTMAVIFVALIPLMRRIVDHPQDIGQTVRVRELAEGERHAQPRASRSNMVLLSDPRFWLLSVGVGVFTTAGTAYVVHAVSIATFKGIDLAAASTLISMFGLGTLIGAIFFGWLADKIGALPALAVNTYSVALTFILIIPAVRLPPLLLLSGLMGCGMGAAVALHSATINDLFGPPSFSRAMGFSYFVKVPFLFGSAPLAGYLFDVTGDYDLALLVNSAGLSIAATTFLMLALYEKGLLGRRLANRRRADSQ